MILTLLASALAAEPATCDWSGDWGITLTQLSNIDPPFSTRATWNKEAWGWCVAHPGGPVNARLDVHAAADQLRVWWMNQDIVDSFTRVQAGSFRPKRGKAAAPPPSTCVQPLPPLSFSDRPIRHTGDAWGYTCVVDPTDCDRLACTFLRGPEDIEVGAFEMVRTPRVD